ncbi:homeodomain-interacting protein kinase 2-like [Pelobates fuscus]|uniref:homeodomain-interacting protein kinase 2-like n=1 Tax=Pelobates fuscus TaxID=191477 RepID=UPI002FE480E3
METNLDTSESEEYEDDLLKLEQGDILCSSTNDYIVQEFLGSGSFGNVVKGVIRATNENVAIKILKDHPRVVKYAKAEVEILSQLNKENPDKFNVVKHYEYFQHNDNMCLVFEMLDISLYDFIKKRNNRPLPVRHIRPIVQQVGNALDKLKSLQIIHTDLKPENIMLVNTSKYPFKIKVIDFGCAIHTSKVRVPSYIQTRYYRSPEIILGLPFSEAIDMWSVGCIIAELFTGYPLYPGSSEYDQIRYITETQGLPPDNMLNLGAKTEDYFRNDSECEVLLWSLKSENHYEYETGISPVETRRYVFSSLDDMRKVILPLKLVSSDTLVEMGDVWQFIDLLKEMLTMDPDKRITPIGLLSHPFITMAHLQHFARSSYVNHCFQAMEINKEQEVCPESESSNEEEKEKDYNERLLELQCAAEDVMVSPACGMGIIIHNSNYNVNTDIEQEMWPDPPEMETESSNEEEKEKDYNGRLLELQCAAEDVMVSPACGMGIIIHNSNYNVNTDIEQVCFESPEMETESSNEEEKEKDYNGRLLELQCAAEDVMVSPACGMGIIIHNSNYNVNTDIEQVCFESPEMETESSNEEEKEKDYNGRLLELQCAAEDVMVSPACGMGIIIHNSNYNVNTDIEQVCFESPEMETESSNEEEKEKDYNGRLLELVSASMGVTGCKNQRISVPPKQCICVR